ncbi:hypothetical protein Q7P36_010725 [Cladosporium allicinum]
MQYTTALILAVASLAAAQSTTSTSSAATSSATGVNQSGCGQAIDAIITNCLASTGLRVESCASNDWDCLCANSQAVLTCYDNCPSDPRRPSEEQTNTSYCNAAKAYPSSSSSSSAFSAVSSGASQTSGSASSTASDSEASETDSASSATSSGASRASSASESAASATGDSSAAGNLNVPAIMAGAVAGVFGLAAVVV